MLDDCTLCDQKEDPRWGLAVDGKLRPLCDGCAPEPGDKKDIERVADLCRTKGRPPRFDPKEMLTAQRAKMLWCVHVLGPDELHAMPSYEAAEKNVEELIAYLFTERASKLNVLCLPVVATWPYSAEEHRKALEQDALRSSHATRKEGT